MNEEASFTNEIIMILIDGEVVDGFLAFERSDGRNPPPVAIHCLKQIAYLHFARFHPCAVSRISSPDPEWMSRAGPQWRSLAYAGGDPEEMGIGPVHAIPKALKMAGLALDQIDVIELNEAFAAQSLAVIKTLGIDPKRVNVNGGAIALGHPLGCTGAKLTATLLAEFKRSKAKYGLVTMCVGGGMGAAGIFENLQN